MQIKPVKAMVAAGWLAAVCALGVVLDVSSVGNWAIFLAAGALPPILYWRWTDPAQTLSESIQEARR